MRELARYVQALTGIGMTAAQITAFERYEQELLAWNARMNLTAIRQPEEIRTKHFLDSLTCLCVMKDTPMERVIDVGTGAGFPGIPLKIIYPQIKLTLVESVGKKLNFCQHVVQVLGLENVLLLQDRAEVIGQMPQHRETYDWAVARAVAVLPVLSEYLLPLVRVGGAMLAQKGETAPSEAHRAEHALRMLGGRLRRLNPLTLPGVVEERYLVVVDKVAATPKHLPRRTGIPAKNPL